MKKLLSHVTLAAFAAALFALTGCKTVSTSHTQDIGAPHFAPSNPALIQILRTEPTRAHVRLGEVRAEPSSPDLDATLIETALRNEAAKLGADAVVVLSDRTEVTGAEVVGSLRFRTVEEVQGRIVVAAAIKYQ